MKVMRIVRGVKFAAVVLAALALAGCAKQQIDQTAMGWQRRAGQPAGLRRQCRRPRVLRDRLDRAHAASARRRSTSRRSGSATTAATRSPSKAMPTSAARANTTSRSAPAARRPCANISSRAASRPQRMRTISYGKERPVAVCNDISCWSQNRRAVTVLNQAHSLCHWRGGAGRGQSSAGLLGP